MPEPHADPKFANGAGIDWELLAKDKTCQLCAPFGADDFGCGGMGATGLNAWYSGPARGPLAIGFAGLLRTPSHISAKTAGMQPSDVIGSDLAPGSRGSRGASCHDPGALRHRELSFCEHCGARLALAALLVFASLPGFLLCCEPRARSESTRRAAL
jgi:hypothetical protein